MITDIDNNAYGNTVSISSDGTTDIYIIGSSLSFSFPTGTPQLSAYLSMAKQIKISQFKSAVNQFVADRYTVEERQNFFALYINAQSNSIANRLLYIQQLLNWQTSVISYCSSFISSVSSSSSESDVASLQWDFSSLDISNPKITSIAAIQISS